VRDCQRSGANVSLDFRICLSSPGLGASRAPCPSPEIDRRARARSHRARPIALYRPELTGRGRSVHARAFVPTLRPRISTQRYAGGRRWRAPTAGGRRRGAARRRRGGGGSAVAAVSAPSSRSTRAPAPTRATRRQRSTRGGAAAGPPANSSVSTASVGDDTRSLELRRRNSTAGATRSHHRGMTTRSARSHERDHFLSTVASVRDLVLHYARTSTWMFTLACGFACGSLQVPLPNDNTTARALFLLASMSAGALLGKWIDRWTRRRT